MKRPGAAAATRWYAAGFSLGAGGANPGRRRGRPRYASMVAHWRRGIVDGKFAAKAFVGAYAAAVRLGAEMLRDHLGRESS